MRSLAPTTVQVASINLTSAASRAGQLAVDPESGTVYATIEKATDDGLEVDIVRIEGLEEGAEFSEVRCTQLVLANLPGHRLVLYPRHCAVPPRAGRAAGARPPLLPG